MREGPTEGSFPARHRRAMCPPRHAGGGRTLPHGGVAEAAAEGRSAIFWQKEIHRVSGKRDNRFVLESTNPLVRSPNGSAAGAAMI